MSELDPIEGLELLPQPITIITVGDPDKPGERNGMTAAWVSRVSWDPPLVMVSIAPERYTYELLKKYREFAINIVSRELIDVALNVFGAVSGRDHDKFDLAKIVPGKAKKIKAPIIKEAPVVIECRVEKFVEVGDHVLVIGRVLTVYRNNELKPVVWYDSSPREIV